MTNAANIPVMVLTGAFIWGSIVSCSKTSHKADQGQRSLDSSLVMRLDTLACWKQALAVGPEITSDSGTPGISFLRGGDVWFYDVMSGVTKQITTSGGGIGNYSISHDFRYLAIDKVIGSHRESGQWEDTAHIPIEFVYGITVIDLMNDSVVWKSPNPGESATIQSWAKDDVLLFYTHDDFAVGGFYEYNVQLDSLLTLPYESRKSRRLEYFNRADSLIARGIHLWREPAYLDRMKVNGGSSTILDGPLVDPDTLMAALLNVRDVKKHTTYLDEIWLHDLRSNSFGSIYQQPARSEHKEISWSPDGRMLGLFFSSDALIFDVRVQDGPRIIPGDSFAWTPGAWLLHDYKSSVYLCDPATKADILVLANAGFPGFARWRKP